MSAPTTGVESARPNLLKCPTGILGLDEITGGGLPRGRTTLVCGGPGCGKTLLGLEFLVRGVTRYDEPGVFLTFDESTAELTQNAASIGFDLDALTAQGMLAVDHIRIDHCDVIETGAYDLEGLFLRLGYSIDRVKARRVVLDTLESLFGGLKDQLVLRAEFRRLFRWLKDRGLTAIVTAERGNEFLTRHGLEEYISDCVILLDHRVHDQVSTRRLRVVKYRGTGHGANEYPFLIDDTGLSVLPVTSLALKHEVSNERVSSGIPRLDAMLAGQGYYRGSSILVSGTAGTGKTTLSAYFADATCRRGERCLYLAFEESQSQVVRDIRSIGLDLEKWITQGLLRFHAARATSAGLENHLVTIHKLMEEFQPHAVIVDPISSFLRAGDQTDACSMTLRLVDYLKGHQITAFFTNLVTRDHPQEATELAISSIIDTWLLLRDIELGGERNRGLYVLKSRGMSHSNQIREFHITDQGVELLDAYLGPAGVLTGSMRLAQEVRDQGEVRARSRHLRRLERALERKRQRIQSRIAALQLELEGEEEEFEAANSLAQEMAEGESRERVAMAKSRKAEDSADPSKSDQPVAEGETR